MAKENNENPRLDLFSGLFNTADGIHLGVDGEAYDRIFISTLGTIKVGDGTIPPTTFGTTTISGEDVMDTVAALVQAGAHIAIAYNDPGNTLTFSVTGLSSVDISDFSEAAQDVVGAMLAFGTGLSGSYNDTSGVYTISLSGLTETIQDTVGAMLVAGTGITLVYDDAAGTVTITSPDVSNIPINARSYGAKGDTRNMYVSTTSGSDVLTMLGSWPTAAPSSSSGYETIYDTPGTFVPSDVGKRFLVRGAGAAGALLQGTLIAYIDSTHMQMSVTAGTSVSNSASYGTNSNYPSANYGTDDSAAIQAAMAAAYLQKAAGSMVGGTVILPAGAYYAKSLVIPSGVHLVGEGRATQIWAAPHSGTTATVTLGNPTNAAKKMSIRSALMNLSVYGQGEAGLLCRAIDFTINNETWQNFQAFGPNDSAHWIQDVYVHDSGGDCAVFTSINVRGLVVSNLFILNSKNDGMWMNSTDAFLDNVSIGASGNAHVGAGVTYDIKINGANSKVVNSKFWYNLSTNGDGIYLGSLASHVQLVNCETQDHTRYGMTIENTNGAQILDHLSSGDLLAGVNMMATSGLETRYNTVKFKVTTGDRWDPKGGIILDGTGVKTNTIDISAESTFNDPTYVHMSTINSANAGLNMITSQGLVGHAGNFLGGATGALNPDFSDGVGTLLIVLVGNTTINQVARLTTYGQIPPNSEVTFIFVQDATGGRTLTWNAVWGTNIPAVRSAANAVTTYKFTNYGGSLTAPSWTLTSYA